LAGSAVAGALGVVVGEPDTLGVADGDTSVAEGVGVPSGVLGETLGTGWLAGPDGLMPAGGTTAQLLRPSASSSANDGLDKLDQPRFERDRPGVDRWLVGCRAIGARMAATLLGHPARERALSLG